MSEESLRKYKSGDKVIVSNGISSEMLCTIDERIGNKRKGDGDRETDQTRYALLGPSGNPFKRTRRAIIRKATKADLVNG